MAFRINTGLSQAGLSAGQMIGSAFGQLGGSIGGMLTRGGEAIREGREDESAQQQFQQILAANQNNPDVLRTKGQEMMTSRDPNMQRIGKMLMDEAVRLTGVRTAQKTALETSRQDIQREAQRKRAMQVAMQDKDQNALVALRANALDPVEYLSGRATAEPKDKFKVVGNRVFNTETEQYVEPSEAAELLPLGNLKDAVTPESLIEYIQTGDKSVLKAVLTEEQLDKNVVQDLLATDQVLATVDKALGLTDEYWVVGYDIAKMLPLPTDARQMETYVQTLRSNLAFDRLQKMRDRSKTGGALGQVSNIELKLLESSVAALDPGSKNFKEQLAEVRHQYENFRRSLLGLEPDSARYFKENGKLYYDFNGEWIDLEEAAKENRFNLSPSPKTGGEI